MAIHLVGEGMCESDPNNVSSVDSLRPRRTGGKGFNAYAKFRTLADLLLECKSLDGSSSMREKMLSIVSYVTEKQPYRGFTEEKIVLYRGKRFVLNGSGGLGIVSCQYYEPVSWRFVSSMRGGTFANVGANVGAYVIWFGNNFERTIAIEPGPIACEMLRKNVDLNGIRNVTTVQRAIGSESGTASLFVARNLVNWTLKGESGEAVTVKTSPLDEVLGEVGRVRLLLIDVEGSELEVIKSARDALSRVDYILVETRKNVEDEVTRLIGRFDKKCMPLEDRGTDRNLLFSPR